MPSLVSLADIADHHTDSEQALRLYFSAINPTFTQHFVGYMPSEIAGELSRRIDETDMRSALVTLARVEAALRTDYLRRCKAKLSDNISIEFRRMNKAKGNRVRLDEDILKVWQDHSTPELRAVLSRLRGMLKFRHWLAHGRYWQVGNTHSFQDVYIIAELTISNLSLQP